MPFTVPSFSEVLDDLVADFKNRFPNSSAESRLSPHWKRLAVIAGGVASLHRHLQVIARDVMPDTAAGAQLGRHGSIYGVTRKGATAAYKADALRLTGTPGSSFTTGDQLTTRDGLVFQVNETGVIPAGGYIDVDVLAISTGAETRKAAGTVMTFSSPPSGIDATAVLQLDMDEGGLDEEIDGDYRVRILDTIAQPGMGGNANDFRQWAKEVAWVDEAYVWPLRAGLGSVHLAALKAGAGSVRLPNASEIAELQAYIDAKRPAGYADFEVLTVVLELLDVEVLLTPEEDPAYAFDWDDESSWTVHTFTPDTRVLKFNGGTRPADMVVGDHIVYDRFEANTGEQIAVEALGPAADEITLEDHPDLQDALTRPSGGNAVYSGGPLVASVWQAIVDYMNGLGPGRADSVEADTDHSYGSSYWEGTLRLAKLHNLAQKQKGVLDSEVLAPATNTSPANVAPTLSVGLLSPRQVLVRKKW